MMALPNRIAYPLPARLPDNVAGWHPDPTRAVLLVHDMQRYFLRGFAPNRDPLATTVRTIGRLRDTAARLGIPVFYTVQPGGQQPAERGLLTDFWGPGIGVDAGDTGILDVLAPRPDDTVLTKHRYSATVRTGLLDRLAGLGRDQVLITGVYTHIGCLATALDLFMADVQPFLIADGTADFSATDHERALDYAARRCAVVLTGAAARERLGIGSADDQAWLAAEIDELIGRPGAAGDDDDLFEAGLDSVRAMALIDRIGDRGIELDMVDLLAQPTLRGLRDRVRTAARLP